MSALRELLAKFSIEVDDKKLESFDSKLKETVEKVKDLAEVIGGGIFGEAVKEFVDSQVEAANQLRHTSEVLGVSTDELQRFQYAARATGSSVDMANVGLRFLNKNVGEAIKGGGDAADIFRKFHISLRDSNGQVRATTDIVGDVAEALKGTQSQAERTRIAMALFGRGGAELLPMLQEGKEGIEASTKAFDEFGGVQKDFIENSEKMEKAQAKLRLATDTLKSRVANALLPVFAVGVEKVTKFVSRFLKLTKETNILKTATMALTTIAFAVFLKKIWDVVGGLKGLISLFSEFAGPVALALILYGIFDDLFTLFEGGDSTIGTVLDHLYGIGTATAFVQELKDTWNGFLSALGLTGDVADGAIGKKGGLTFWIESAVDATMFLIDLFETILNLMANIARGLKDLFKGDLQKFSDEFLSIGDTVVDGISKAIGDFTEGKIGDVRHGLSQAQVKAGTAGTGIFTQTGAFVSSKPSIANGTAGPMTQQNDIKINVQGGNGSPAEIGAAVKKGAKEALDGVRNRNAFGAVGTGT